MAAFLSGCNPVKALSHAPPQNIFYQSHIFSSTAICQNIFTKVSNPDHVLKRNNRRKSPGNRGGRYGMGHGATTAQGSGE
jgi:hypothetical protein